jgi:hypothetical protein
LERFKGNGGFAFFPVVPAARMTTGEAPEFDSDPMVHGGGV